MMQYELVVNCVNANRDNIEHVPQFTDPFIKLKVFYLVGWQP